MSKKTKRFIEANISVQLKKQGDYVVAYCPALNVSSYGTDDDDARKAFDEALEIFLEETSRKGTLEKELLKLGWKLQLLPVAKYSPPVLSLQKLNNKTVRESIQIPV